MRFHPRLIAALVLLCVPLCGLADDGPPAGLEEPSIMTDPRVVLVKDRAVQDELRLSDEQRERIGPLIDVLDVPLFALRDYRPDIAADKAPDKLKAMQAAIDRIEHVLTRRQLQRLDQIAWRAEGPLALARAEPAGQLELSVDQRQRIAEIARKAYETINKLNHRTAADNAQAQALAESKSEAEKLRDKGLVKVLTDDQAKKWLAMQGRPFDFSRVGPPAMKAPEIAGVDAWINTEPLTLKELRGQVVVLHFWTFGCINCIRNWPIYERWGQTYSERGVTILGIHTPETQGEYDIDSIRKTAREKNLSFAIAVDNRKENWNAWSNNAWPSVYVIDKTGRVRYWWYGELNWQDLQGEKIMTKRIDELLAEKGEGGPATRPR